MKGKTGQIQTRRRVVQFKQSWQSRKEHLVHLDHWGEEGGEKKQRNSAKQIGRKVTADGTDCSKKHFLNNTLKQIAKDQCPETPQCQKDRVRK